MFDVPTIQSVIAEAFRFRTCNCSRKVYSRGRLPTSLRVIVTTREKGKEAEKE